MWGTWTHFSSLRGLRLNQFVLHTIWWCWGDLNPTYLLLERKVTQPLCLQHHIRCILKTVKKVYSLPFDFIVGCKVSFGNILGTLVRKLLHHISSWVILPISWLPINQLYIYYTILTLICQGFNKIYFLFLSRVILGILFM